MSVMVKHWFMRGYAHQLFAVGRAVKNIACRKGELTFTS
jgi:hypothetical protein